jgi:hypothetical protein
VSLAPANPLLQSLKYYGQTRLPPRRKPVPATCAAVPGHFWHFWRDPPAWEGTVRHRWWRDRPIDSYLVDLYTNSGFLQNSRRGVILMPETLKAAPVNEATDVEEKVPDAVQELEDFQIIEVDDGFPPSIVSQGCLQCS